MWSKFSNKKNDVGLTRWGLYEILLRLTDQEILPKLDRTVEFNEEFAALIRW